MEMSGSKTLAGDFELGMRKSTGGPTVSDL